MTMVAKNSLYTRVPCLCLRMARSKVRRLS